MKIQKAEEKQQTRVREEKEADRRVCSLETGFAEIDSILPSQEGNPEEIMLRQDLKEAFSAGIVLYNPDINRLKQAVQSVSKQVESLFFVDNFSENILEIEELLSDYPQCRLIKNKENRGVAAALNQLMQQAEEEGYTWLLTLDDDSVCDPDMLEHLLRWTGEERIGIVCARAFDDKMREASGQRKSKKVKSDNKEDSPREVQDCITAGSLTNIAAWRKIGGFDEKMFIDFVDIEFCARLRENGYRILQDPAVCVHQQYGNISGSFALLGTRYYLFNYSPTRIYHSVRNQIYFIKKHKSGIHKRALFLIGYICKRLLFEKKRLQSLKAICKGVKDGIKM